MFLLNKRLQYTVRVAQPTPGLANLLLNNLGELRASSQRRPAISPKRWPKMIQAERICLWTLPRKLSHLEIVGSTPYCSTRSAPVSRLAVITSRNDLCERRRGRQ